MRVRTKTVVAAVAASAFALALAAPPVAAARAASPRVLASNYTSWLATTPLPQPSDNGLALDRRTGNVFALTELGDNDEPGDTDLVAAAATTPSATCPVADEYCVVVISPKGQVLRNVGVREESEYMAVDPTVGRHRLYVSQYDDTWPGAKQYLAIINLDKWTVQYQEIPYTYLDTGYEYDPEGLAVDESTGIVYIGAKPPEIEGEEEGGQGAILAFDGNTNTFLNGFVTAGDDPESTVFNPKDRRVYTANEDEGTLTVAPAARRGAKVWNTAGSFTTDVVFDAGDCAGSDTYNPIEADKMVVNPVTGVTYLTDDLYRVAAIPATVDKALTGVKVLRLAATCPNSNSAGFYNYANNLAVAPNLGLMAGRTRAGVLYVTSESSDMLVVELKNFEVMGSYTVGDASGPAVHLEWPVINPDTNRLYVSDEGRPDVFIYTLKDFAVPIRTRR